MFLAVFFATANKSFPSTSLDGRITGKYPYKTEEVIQQKMEPKGEMANEGINDAEEACVYENGKQVCSAQQTVNFNNPVVSKKEIAKIIVKNVMKDEMIESDSNLLTQAAVKVKIEGVDKVHKTFRLRNQENLCITYYEHIFIMTKCTKSPYQIFKLEEAKNVARTLESPERTYFNNNIKTKKHQGSSIEKDHLRPRGKPQDNYRNIDLDLETSAESIIGATKRRKRDEMDFSESTMSTPDDKYKPLDEDFNETEAYIQEESNTNGRGQVKKKAVYTNNIPFHKVNKPMLDGNKNSATIEMKPSAAGYASTPAVKSRPHTLLDQIEQAAGSRRLT